MENRLFNITNCYITCGIESLINEGSLKEKELHEILLKHMCNIDDNKYKEDLEANLEAIKTGSGRVLSVYELNGKISAAGQPAAIFNYERKMNKRLRLGQQ